MIELQPTTCPSCVSVRIAQGFPETLDVSQPLCASCATAKAEKDYMESAAYQAWVALIPTTSMEAAMEWIRGNPPPPRS